MKLTNHIQPWTPPRATVLECWYRRAWLIVARAVIWLFAICLYVMVMLVFIYLVVGLLGCTVMMVDRRPDGSMRVRACGAPMVNREGSIRVIDYWLDERTNTLHQNVIEQSGKENTDQQAELILKALELGATIGARGAVQ